MCRGSTEITGFQTVVEAFPPIIVKNLNKIAPSILARGFKVSLGRF
jgi:hypothetical protein